MPDPALTNPGENPETEESFTELLSQYEKSHRPVTDDGGRQLEGTVVKVDSEFVILDIGYKSEGVLPLTAFPSQAEIPSPGDKLTVTVKGRTPEGFYDLSRFRVKRPTDWTSLEKAFADKATIVGTVTAVVKGGLSVDVGVRAFMPASRSGARDAAEMEKLVGQEVRCRISKLDATEEDVVVDARVVAEEEARGAKERRYSEIQEGDLVNGTVRSLTDYGAFVDIGGVDALLHVGDMAWVRVTRPADLLSVGQEIEAKVLKVSSDGEKRRISVGLKQLQPDPWDSASERYKNGERVRGTVSRIADFGAFVELEPGVEGLVHLSEMTWAKKARKPGDVVKPGETVEVVVLGVNGAERRISLGLKQALGDPWDEVPQRFPAGSVVEGPVTSIMKFGAFVQLAEGVEGMIHVSEISAEKRINHPQDVLRTGQTVKAQVLAVDKEKRQLRLSMKQLVPTSLDEYLAENSVGDVVTGRIIDEVAGSGRVELGEGIEGRWSSGSAPPAAESPSKNAAADLQSLSSMLSARWKGGGGPKQESKPEAPHAGQVRSFRITKIDLEKKTIEVELAR